jgi:membrane protein implicated in regulation of membrane protease activity
MTPTEELSALGGHSQAHQEMTYWIALAAFLLIVGVLLLLYRYSQKRVEMEEIDALLRQEDVL